MDDSQTFKVKRYHGCRTQNVVYRLEHANSGTVAYVSETERTLKAKEEKEPLENVSHRKHNAEEIYCNIRESCNSAASTRGVQILYRQTKEKEQMKNPNMEGGSSRNPQSLCDLDLFYFMHI